MGVWWVEHLVSLAGTLGWVEVLDVCRDAREKDHVGHEVEEAGDGEEGQHI